MPASPVKVRVRLRPGCPACAEGTCPDPAECLHWLTSRPWGKCTECAGSGWSTDSGLSPRCGFCNGSGLEEYTSAGFVPAEHTTPQLVARHASYVEALRARLADSGSLAVVA